MPDKSLADKLLLWGTLGEGMKSRPQELAFLEEQRRELVARLEQVEALMTEENNYEARLRETTRQRIEAETQAGELCSRLIGALKARYGKRNPVLHQFGIRPNEQPGPRGKRHEEPPPPTEESAQ